VTGWRRPIGERHPDPYRAKAGQPLTDDGPVRGIPLGGLGTGSIGRDHDGRFARSHLSPGDYRSEASPGSWLGLQVTGEGPPVALVAAGCETRPTGLAPAAGPVGEYEALFPFAWYRYRPGIARGVRAEVRQWSPVVPGREAESAWPVGCFEVTLTSERDGPCEVVVALAFELPVADQALAGAGRAVLAADGPVAAARFPAAPASFALAVEGAGAETAATGLDGDAAYEGLGGDLWRAAAGRCPGGADAAGRPGLVVAARLRLEPGRPRVVAFSLAWDLPLVRFGDRRQHAWYRAHTREFGRSGDAAAAIACAALARRSELAGAVAAWHADLAASLRRWGAPDWLLPALCNELYVLVDGGTAWVVGRPGGAEGTDGEHFSVLECIDYRYYETLDVRYYSSFALLELWPRLERVVIDDYLRSVALADGETLRTQWNGAAAVRKRPGAAPHDLGGPLLDPFHAVNAYELHDSGTWRDLNPKLVLQVARDAALLEDDALAAAAWPVCREAIRAIEAYDADGDGLPDHASVPDQTYDTWPMRGVSAYIGDLWVACLAAGEWLAERAGDREEAARLRELAGRARPALERALWTGSHYRFDSAGAPASEVVIADQLAGTWYARLLRLPGPHPEERAERALDTVLATNFRGFAGGRLGPVNGRSPDGGPADVGSEQAHEVWVGVAWGLASLALLMGRDADAWDLGEALYRTLYEDSGLWFRTPEAWTEDRRFRAPVYHRPLAVWSVYTALRRRALSPTPLGGEVRGGGE
jgi:non-lysosomal glucosylceramidase